MPSKARQSFDANAKDVERLLSIHSTIGGDAKGRRYGLEVLNKSAIVLITAFWEAYCEDIATESLQHIIDNIPNATSLPKELKKLIANEIKKDTNEIAIWDLADDGWKVKVQARLAALTQARNKKLNTPKSANIDELFYMAIGLQDISKSWHWKSMTSENAKIKLDEFISLRGEIAHRGASASGCSKKSVESYFDHINLLCAKTGGAVNKFVKTITGKPLYESS